MKSCKTASPQIVIAVSNVAYPENQQCIDRYKRYATFSLSRKVNKKDMRNRSHVERWTNVFEIASKQLIGVCPVAML